MQYIILPRHQLCQIHEVPVVFGLNRRKLGKAMSKRSKVSCIGVFDVSGANVMFKTLLTLVKAAKIEDMNEERRSLFFERAIAAAEEEIEAERKRALEADREELEFYKYS